MVKGLDVSSNQGTIDWRKVAAAGYDFAFIKVNEGDLLDPTAERNAHEAKAAGLIVGGYDFLRPGGGGRGAHGEREWEIFQRHAKAIGLLHKGCLRPVPDIEATSLDAAGTRSYLRSWVREAFQDLGKHPIIYTGQWFYDGPQMAEHHRRHGCKLWLAAYVPKTQVKTYIPRAWAGHKSIWQHTDQGAVPGIHGHVDLNTYGSTLRNLKRTHTL